MTPMMYSHRLKTVLQHTVRELGLTLSLTDENTPLALIENEAMIRETTAMLRVQVSIEQSENGACVTFYQ